MATIESLELRILQVSNELRPGKLAVGAEIGEDWTIFSGTFAMPAGQA